MQTDIIHRLSGGAAAGRAAAAGKALEKIKSEEGIISRPFVPKKRSFAFPAPERMGQRVLEINGLTHGYGDRALFDNVNLEIEKGERVAIIGARPALVYASGGCACVCKSPAPVHGTRGPDSFSCPRRPQRLWQEHAAAPGHGHREAHLRACQPGPALHTAQLLRAEPGGWASAGSACCVHLWRALASCEFASPYCVLGMGCACRRRRWTWR